MSNFQSHKKRYVLTNKGKQKLEKALKEVFGEKSPSDNKVAEHNSLDRGTIAKIRNGDKGVNLSSLERLFEKLSEFSPDFKLELHEDDYQEFAPLNNKSQIATKNNELIPNQSNAEKLIDALRELNYLEQENSFIKFVRELKPAGAFLIHGKEGYGQRWVAHRLSYKVPYFTDAFYSSLCFKRHRRDIQTLWQNLAQEFGSYSDSPEDIVEAVYEHWQTQTVMLCFRDVDLVAGEYLNQLLREFWLPLVTKVLKQVQSSNEPDDEHPLLLFLIDNFGCKEKLGITCMSQFDCNQPANPVEINELSSFNEREIKRWVRTKKQLFTTQLPNSTNINTIISDIIERNSIPETALKAICSWCDLDWYEDIQRQLKL